MMHEAGFANLLGHARPLFTRYPIVARSLGLAAAAFRPSARASKIILHTSLA